MTFAATRPRSRKSAELPIVFDLADFPQTAPARTVNLYGQKVASDQFVNRTSPGLRSFGAVAGTGGMRGLLRYKGTVERLFAIRGATLAEWDDSSSTFVARGLLASSFGRVGMTFNETNAGVKQVLIVDGTKAYKYEVGNTSSFAQISPFQGGNGAAVFASLRGFSIGPGTGKIWASDFDDLWTWNPLAAAEAETFPDPLVALANVGPAVLALGTDSSEPWVDQQLPTFPLRRTQAGSNVGCSAPQSVAIYGQSAFWLGGSREGRGQVYRSAGYVPQRISTDEVERIIASFSDFTDAVGYLAQEQGHIFYVLNFGVGDRTLAYDVATGIWAEWNYRNGDGTFSRHPTVCQAVYLGKNLVGDARNGNVYELSMAQFTNDGLPIVREKIFPIWPADPHEFTAMPPFYVDLDVGQAASGADEPVAYLSWSDDRGKTYGNEIPRGLGLTGQYNRRVVWDGLGSSYGRAYRLRLEGPVAFTLRGAGML